MLANLVQIQLKIMHASLYCSSVSKTEGQKQELAVYTIMTIPDLLFYTDFLLIAPLDLSLFAWIGRALADI